MGAMVAATELLASDPDRFSHAVDPAGDESWGDKWFRSRRAVTHALSPRSQHEAKVDLELRRQHRRRGDDSRGVSFDEVQVDDSSAS